MLRIQKRASRFICRRLCPHKENTGLTQHPQVWITCVCVPYWQTAYTVSGQTPEAPRSLSFARTTHLGFTAMAYQLGVFFPRDLCSSCGKRITATEACLFEQSGGSTTICTIPDFLAAFVRDWDFLIDSNPLLNCVSHQSIRQRPGFHPDAHGNAIERGASRREAKFPLGKVVISPY